MLVRRPGIWVGLIGASSAALRHVTGSVLLAVVLFGGGCAEQQSPQDSFEGFTKEGDTPARTFVVQCKRSEGRVVTFRALVRPDSLTLQVPAQLGGGTRQLWAVEAASGAKYEDDGGMVWSKGSTANVEVDGQRFQDCTIAPQSERREGQHPDLQFRAVGQEPGWLIEVTDDSLRFAWDYGQHEVILSRFSKKTDAGRIIYRAETGRGPVRIVAEPQHCTDPMNGRLFSHTVTVTLAGDTHTGCGHLLP